MNARQGFVGTSVERREDHAQMARDNIARFHGENTDVLLQALFLERRGAAPDDVQEVLARATRVEL